LIAIGLTLVARIIIKIVTENNEPEPLIVALLPLVWDVVILIVIIVTIAKLLYARHIFSIKLNTRQVLIASFYLLFSLIA